MDGNGRWAEQQNQPRHYGHRAGVHSVRTVVEESVRYNVPVLTLFAFSSENWQRPKKEVGFLMDLFMQALKREVKRLHKNNIKLRIIGERSAFTDKLQLQIEQAEKLTSANTGLVLQIAANYGGRWDMAQAARKLAEKVAAKEICAADIDVDAIARELSFSDLPDPDLFIRTGGEKRISNFMLWQAAYAELYFSDKLWPDFDAQSFLDALTEFASRVRRFGKTDGQLSDQEVGNVR